MSSNRPEANCEACCSHTLHKAIFIQSVLLHPMTFICRHLRLHPMDNMPTAAQTNTSTLSRQCIFQCGLVLCTLQREGTKVPWKQILSKGPVWALILSHFCHNWGTFILLTWMPTYYNQVLGLDLMKSGFYSVLPWITMALAANVGGWVADSMVARGISVTRVRKIMQSVRAPPSQMVQLSVPHHRMGCQDGTGA